MTLWLTRITVNPRDRQARIELANAVRMHQRIMTLMPEGLGASARHQTGVLYRIDETRTGTQLLIQSMHAPNLAVLPDTYGTADAFLLAALGRHVRSDAVGRETRSTPREFTGTSGDCLIRKLQSN